MSNLPEILTMQEAAAWLRCSKAHVSNAINGKLPGLPILKSIPVGRRRLIRRETLMKWAAEIESPGIESTGRNFSPETLPERIQ